MPFNEEVGIRLKTIRIYADLKQKDLAEKLLIPPTLLSMYETGKREPSIKFVHQFCSNFNISMSHFFDFHSPLSKGNQLNSKEILKKDILEIISTLEVDELSKFRFQE